VVTEPTKEGCKGSSRASHKPNLPEGYELDEAKYSAKAARAGADIGKPGKMFSKIATKAGEKYGSEERGKKVAGAILAKIRAKHMKEDSSFNSAPEMGKSVNEVAMAMPPAINPPAIVRPAAKQTQQSVRTSARFGQQGASARPMTPTSQATTSAVRSPSFMNTSKLATPVKAVADAGSKAATVASRVPAVASRVAGLMARANPIVAGASLGAAASQAAKSLATGTETGRAVGKAIGRAINPPVSSLPKSEPAAAPKASPSPSTVGIKKGDTMTSIAKAQKTSVADLAKANPDVKDVNKISAGKSLNLPSASNPAYTPKPVDQAATMKAAGDTPSVQTGTAAPKSAPLPPERPSAPTPPEKPAELSLPKIDKGPAPGAASVPNPKVNVPTPPSSSERPAPAPMQNPDQNRTKVMKEEVQIGDYKYRIV